MRIRVPWVCAALLLEAACTKEPPAPKKEAPAAAPVGTAGGDAPAAAGEPEALDAARLPAPDLSVEFLRKTTKLLSDDAMEGRGVGTEGGRRAVEVIEALMQRAGLEPAGDGGGYRQRVPMRKVEVDMRHTGLSVRSEEGKDYARLHVGKEIVATSLGPAGPHRLQFPLVFAGYGITAPEYGWDDYAGVDVEGKVVVVLVGDPPTGDDRFDGPALTYYGRWSYKFERALEAGAAGCLVIHETEPASYGWNVVLSSWRKPRFQVLEADGALPPALAIQGWLSTHGADKIAKMAGQSLHEWHQKALRKGFRAKPLPLVLGGDLATRDQRVEDVNVVGKVPGANDPGSGVVVTAHWDHLGKGKTRVPGEDVIWNGAIDNASGVAGMLAVAGAVARSAKEGRGPARTVVFVATTAEEQGLLGAKYHAAHPAIPIERLWAAFNLDSMNVDGKTRNVEVVGMGRSTLEDVLAEVVKGQGRVLTPDERPGAGGYFRSDHFAFARRGVPALYFRGGLDFLEGGRARGEEILARRKARYHTVDDEFDPSWSFEGALEDAAALREVIERVTGADRRPAWKKSSGGKPAGGRSAERVPTAPRPVPTPR